MVTFGALLRAARQSAGETQDDLARWLGVRQQAVNRWEADKDRPRPDLVKKLATRFGWDPRDVCAALGYVEFGPDDALGPRVIPVPEGVSLSPSQIAALHAMIHAFAVAG